MIKQARRQQLHQVFQQLLNAFGPQHWWPADSALEVIIGAILTQNTAWSNVEKAIQRLRLAHLLDLDAISTVPEEELRELIRASGYYNQKARKLKGFFRHLDDHWQRDLGAFLAQPLPLLRQELLSLRGIGPETADSIVLYAAGQPSFVVDLYTHRLFARHQWVPEECGYDDLRAFFMDNLDPDVDFFKEYHALIVRLGHLYCRKTPACARCPLAPLLPEGHADRPPGPPL